MATLGDYLRNQSGQDKTWWSLPIIKDVQPDIITPKTNSPLPVSYQQSMQRFGTINPLTVGITTPYIEKIMPLAKSTPLPESDIDIIGGLRTFGVSLLMVPDSIRSGIMQISQGGGQGAGVQYKNKIVGKDTQQDAFISSVQEKQDKFMQDIIDRYNNKQLFPGVKITDLAGLPQSIAYSLTSMGAGLATGLPLLGAAPFTGPLAPAMVASAWALGSATSGKVAYEMTTYQITQQYLEAKDEEKRARTGVGLTQAEEDKLKKDFSGKAMKYGLYEAIPEAVSNLAFGKLLTIPGKILAKPLEKIVGKGIAGKIMTNAFVGFEKIAGIFGEELATETITQMGQKQTLQEAGLPGGDNINWLDPTDWTQSFKEIAPQTFLLTTLMAGAGTTIIKTKDQIVKVQASLARELEENGYSPEQAKAIITSGGYIGGVPELTQEQNQKRETEAKKVMAEEIETKKLKEAKTGKPIVIKTAYSGIKGDIDSGFRAVEESYAQGYADMKTGENQTFNNIKLDNPFVIEGHKQMMEYLSEKYPAEIAELTKNKNEAVKARAEETGSFGIPPEIAKPVDDFIKSKLMKEGYDSLVYTRGNKPAEFQVFNVKNKVNVKKITQSQEEEYRKAVEKEIGTGEEFKKTYGKKLFRDIQGYGGLKVDTGIREEMSDIPKELFKDSGFTPDQIIAELNTTGYNFETGEALIDAIRSVKTEDKAFKQGETNIQRVIKMAQSLERMAKNADKESAKKARAIEREIRRLIREGTVGTNVPTKKVIEKALLEKPGNKKLIRTEWQLLKARIRAEARGAKMGAKGTRELIRGRRNVVNFAIEQFGLDYRDLKRITIKDIRYMSTVEFEQFLTDIEARTERFAVRQQAMNELQQQIIDKELNVENLRKAMKLPTLPNMTIENIQALDEALRPFQKGDVFLSVRKLETVDRTELAGIKTLREARERLAKKLGVALSEVDNIQVSELDRFRWDTPLARRNPFYKMMVEETAKRMLISEAEYLDIEKKTFALAKGIKTGVFVPQYKKVIAYMEAPADAKPTLSEKEMTIAKYMTQEFEKAREYLIKIEAMKLGRENYFVHMRRGVLEAMKEDGVVQAFKEAFSNYKEQLQGFEVLDRQTGQVMALDKFFKYAMHRTGEVKPTQNAVKAFLTYMKTFKKKQAMDEFVPLINIYALALSPTKTTKTGLLLHGNLVQFVKEWLNMKKGRNITLMAKQGGKIDGALRAIKIFTSLRDLGLNVGVGVATEIGEQVTTYQLLGKKNYLKGKVRQNTKQGKEIVKKYENIIGKNPWKELIEPAKGIGDRLMEGIFITFKDASVRANKTFLLGSLSKEEFQAGTITPERLSSLRTELGRYRMIEGAKSIFGATPEGKSFTQYRTWAIPIINTAINNIANLRKVLSNQPANRKIAYKSAAEIYRIIEFTAFVLIIKGMTGGDDDDKSFVGIMISKVYREAMTLIGAMDPTMLSSAGRSAAFIEDLALALKQIALWETYKTKPGLKGVESLKRQLTPMLIKQFQGTESTGDKTLNKLQDEQTEGRTIMKDKAEEELKRMNNMSPEDAANAWDALNETDPNLAEKVADMKAQEAKGLTSVDKQLMSLGVENGKRAEGVVYILNKLNTKEEKAAKWDELVEKKVLTEQVQEQVINLLEQPETKKSNEIEDIISKIKAQLQ